MGSSPARVMLIEVDVMTSRKKLVQLCSAILADVVGSQCGGSESHGHLQNQGRCFISTLFQLACPVFCPLTRHFIFCPALHRTVQWQSGRRAEGFARRVFASACFQQPSLHVARQHMSIHKHPEFQNQSPSVSPDPFPVKETSFFCSCFSFDFILFPYMESMESEVKYIS